MILFRKNGGGRELEGFRIARRGMVLRGVMYLKFFLIGGPTCCVSMKQKYNFIKVTL